MKKILLAAAASGLLAPLLPAATITWQTPSAITGASDVSTQGTYVGSWAPNHADAPNFPVNGVSFQGFSDLPGLNNTLDDGGGYFGGQNTADSNYNTLLSYGRYVYSDESRSVSWGGMTAGQSYLVQIWISDPRNIGQTRWANLSGDGDVSPNVYYPADGTGVGSYIIGTFVADASGNQTITIDPSSLVEGVPGGGSAQINLMQVRLIPEPASLGLAGLGMMSCLLRRRRH
ncbi:PEP-CTERM sorting domain-containing protein [Luteolibacter luteus]|uniref:PEP-CTERM sorting domain-containing protein n=1 Tax=Luteolibacter luteus TaxID=2728835 RepID=A0A858RLM1_9BACT|nr:PEP-CTERM sorting domain-containing protein [Luteolibacter luteus]QJE97279.1 PEP-CTERM sorting domain-containing protein [Luteolibacter luteus]